MSDPHDILKSVFGFDHFRGVQEEVVERVMQGQHTLAVMPTGAGKSLCYQLPAVARDGTALVVSLLIALMHDQIRSANAIGLKAASLTSAWCGSALPPAASISAARASASRALPA